MDELLGDDGKPWDGESAITNPEYFKYDELGPQIPMTGRVARTHNITYVPMTEDEIVDHENENFQHPVRGAELRWVNEKEKQLDRNTPLFSKQSHFGTMGIRHYIDTPDVLAEKDTDYPTPVVYTGKDGRMWIHNGHHRIISSRLRGEQSLKVIDRGVGA
jgi:hypothetical protein